jgi:flagellar biogenesis protein FliO
MDKIDKDDPNSAGGTAGIPRERTFTEAFIQMVLYLGAICLLAYLVLGKVLPRFLRIDPPIAQRRIVQVVDRLPIDQRRSIMVLKIGDLYFLVGSSEHGIGLLSRLEPDEVENALANAEVQKPSLGRLAGVFARRSQKGADS